MTPRRRVWAFSNEAITQGHAGQRATHFKFALAKKTSTIQSMRDLYSSNCVLNFLTLGLNWKGLIKTISANIINLSFAIYFQVQTGENNNKSSLKLSIFIKSYTNTIFSLNVNKNQIFACEDGEEYFTITLILTTNAICVMVNNLLELLCGAS